FASCLALSSNTTAPDTNATNSTSTATATQRTSLHFGTPTTARNRNTTASSTSSIITVAAALRPTWTRRDADITQFCENSPSGKVTVSSPTANASQNERGGMHTSIRFSIHRSCTALQPRYTAAAPTDIPTTWSGRFLNRDITLPRSPRLKANTSSAAASSTGSTTSGLDVPELG